MKGWKYEWAAELPPDVYDVLMEEIQKAAKVPESPEE